MNAHTEKTTILAEETGPLVDRLALRLSDRGAEFLIIGFTQVIESCRKMADSLRSSSGQEKATHLHVVVRQRVVKEIIIRPVV